jgi:hypothetical protein
MRVERKAVHAGTLRISEPWRLTLGAKAGPRYACGLRLPAGPPCGGGMKRSASTLTVPKKGLSSRRIFQRFLGHHRSKGFSPSQASPIYGQKLGAFLPGFNQRFFKLTI